MNLNHKRKREADLAEELQIKREMKAKITKNLVCFLNIQGLGFELL